MSRKRDRIWLTRCPDFDESTPYPLMSDTPPSNTCRKCIVDRYVFEEREKEPTMPGVTKAKVEKAKAAYYKQQAAANQADMVLASAVRRGAPPEEIEKLRKEADEAQQQAAATLRAMSHFGIKV